MTLKISPTPTVSFKARIILGEPPKKFIPATPRKQIEQTSNIFVKKILSIINHLKENRINKLKSKYKMAVQVKLPS